MKMFCIFGNDLYSFIVNKSIKYVVKREKASKATEGK